MMRCMNIALLCVQEKAADRPTMLDVVAMLSNKSMVLVKPKHPAYFNLSSIGNEEASIATQPSSINNVTISVTTGRWVFFHVMICFYRANVTVYLLLEAWNYKE